jgi:membrane fusion protein (multidrug efflux system)
MTELNDPAKLVTETAAPKGRKRLAFGILAVLLATGGTISYFHFRDRVNTDDAQVDGHLVPVSAKVYGSVEKVLVEDNQAVKAGDLLVQIDARDLQSKVDQAAAALNQAQAQVEVSASDDDKARLSYEQGKGPEVQTAEAFLDARKATADRAKADYERMKPLAARQELSALQLDAYRTAAEVAQSEYQAGQRRLNSTRQESEIRRSAMGSQKARVAQARAGVEAAKAHLEALKLELSYTRIQAAVDGVVTRKTVETGQIIQPGQGLLTLVPLHQTWITANFKETQLTKVRAGQPAEVEVDMNGQMLRGTVDSVAGSTGSRMSLLPPENAVGNFVKVVQRIPVKILLDPGDAQKVVLRPGMNVDVTIITR